MSGAVLIRRAGAPLVIDWGRTPLGAAPDSGGRTPQAAIAQAAPFRGLAIDWGRLPRGSAGGAPPPPSPGTSDWIIRTRRRRRGGR